MGEKSIQCRELKLAVHCQPTTDKLVLSALFLLLGALSLAVMTTRAQAQAPGLLWTTNIGARLFAVDPQTNVYANAGGTVIKLSPTGVPLQTNAICPIPGFAQRDSSGNYYFAGSFDGTQNFGGITLVGGWINTINCTPPCWTPGYPTCFLAKYDNVGGLLWAVSFGAQAQFNKATDLMIAPDGSVVVAYVTATAAYYLRDYSASGSNRWQQQIASGPFPIPASATPPWQVRIAKDNATNAYFLVQRPALDGAFGGWFDSDGNSYSFGFDPRFLWTGSETNAKPAVCDSSGVVLAGLASDRSNFVAFKYLKSGGLEWTNNLPSTDPWTLAGDAQGSLYFTDTNGVVYKHDCSGSLAWSINLGGRANSLLISQGIRFLSFQNGVVARLGNDPTAQPPSNLIGPQPVTVFVGDNFQLSVSAEGTLPLRYFWRLYGTNLAGATSSTLTRSNGTPAQAGPYTVLITNAAGSITSAPALVRVRSVALYAGNQLLTNGTYAFASPLTLTVRSAYTNGSAFYTLDGSTPSFASTPYAGPFTVSSNATVRAIGYSADFGQSEEAEVVTLVLPPTYTLTVGTVGPGSVSLNPTGGVYIAATVVTVTATPAAGWVFHHWSGDASGTSPSINVAMTQDRNIQAVFATTLATTVAGNGQVQPAGGVYAYGAVVRLTAIPQPGNYFGAWGNAASGNSVPLYFTITNSNPTVSSLFAATPAGQAALTMLINGPGSINVNPPGNVFPTNQSVTLTAIPYNGQGFINWSGDASGTQNPLSVAMIQSRIITANFTNWPVLVASQQSSTAQGFRFSLLSGPGLTYQVQGSSNLNYWINLGTVTNTTGETQFTDAAGTNLPFRFYRATAWP